MSWRGGIKRTKYDILFSFLVRERADWLCEYCQKDFIAHHHGLHCSHIFGRSNQSIRTHPDNAMAMCSYCHEHLDKNPLLFADFVQSKYSEHKYARLVMRASTKTKYTKWDKEIIHKHYLKEKKRILALRKQGHRGRIDFTMV